MKRKFSGLAFTVALTALSVAGGIWASPAQAQKAAPSDVSLRSEVKIERTVTDAEGKETKALFSPDNIAVVPGDNILFTLSVNNTGAQPAVGFKATNPMPTAVQFDSVTENWAEVSIDNGVTWGKLADFKVKTKDVAGTAEVERAATAQDVTHVRWIFADAILPGTQRTVSYRGVVK